MRRPMIGVLSGGLGKASDDVLVEAEALFGCLDGEPAVKAFSDAQVELA